MCLYPILKNYFLKKNRILYILLENEKFKINDLEKIFDKIMTIQKSIFWIKKLHPFDTFFGTDFWNTINIQVQFIFEQLMNLRSDLATRLTEQRKILESAKSEV